MRKIKFLVAICALAFISCDNYLGVNDSENIILYNQVTPELQLPGAQLSAYRVQATSENQLGNVFMNVWTRNVRSFGNGFDKELQLNIDNGFYTAIWQNTYLSLKNFQDIINNPNVNNQYDNYIAASKICKAYYMQKVVDLYGDAPYKEAWQGNANVTPKYDDDFAIYQDLITELEDARTLISNSNPDAIVMGSKDIMFGGDMNKWYEFANMVQLKLCLRMSNVTGAAATFRDQKLADLAGASFPTAGVPINPGFSTATEANMNPIASTFFYTSGGANQQNRTFITITGHWWKSLRTTAQTWDNNGPYGQIIPSDPLAYANVADNRFTRMQQTGISQTASRAVTQGSSHVNVGADPSAYDQIPSRLGAAGYLNPYGAVTATVANISATKGYLMTNNEIKFILAEVALRTENGDAAYSGIAPGSSATLFNAGIADSFSYCGAGSAVAYTAAINAKPSFGLTASVTFNEKLHAIMYQKWVALAGLNGIESYIDYTRTGYPLTPLSTTAIATRKPYRLIYPISEYIANSVNVPVVNASDCFTINAKTPFWVQ
jgi:hypothetical protein